MTDSTADIPADMAARLNIEVVPTLVNVDGQSLRDGIDLSREDFYRRLPGLRSFPTTSAPAPGAFSAVYQSLVDAGYEIISVHIASSLSAIFSSAQIAANEVGSIHIRVVDSGTVSMALGWQVVAAAERAAAGDTTESILAVLEGTRSKARLLACLDTLEYLRRSGRVNLIQAGLGALLQIKPVLEVREGNLRAIDRVRTRGRVIERMKELAAEWGQPSRLAVVHTADWERAEELHQQLAERYPQAEMLVSEAAPVLGAHVGLGTLGLAALV